MPNVSILPSQGRPNANLASLAALVAPYGIDGGKYPLIVIGIRGYFAAAGTSPGNERNIYDDALFLYAPTLGLAKGFNGNTDPSKIRPGHGQGSARGMASLNAGVWYAYRFDIHGSKVAPHEALCQRAAPVTVTRDGSPSYQDSGLFGINIHRGGNYTTSSEGCQTIPPVQWDEFINTAQEAGRQLFLAEWRQRVVPYALIDAQQAPITPADSDGQPNAAARFRANVIGPTLQRLGLWSESAEELLLGTALVESGLKSRVQLAGGPARGLFQMEPRTHDDIWDNFLAGRPSLARGVGAIHPRDAAALENNDSYACAMARVHYLRVPEALPTAGDSDRMAAYWKTYYNTSHGAGKVTDYLRAWEAAKA